MKDWIQNDWNVFCNPATPGSSGKLLLTDIHQAQQTPEVKTMLARCKTQLVNIPGGLAAYLQVLDIGINKSFKYVVQQQSEKHLQDNLDLYISGKITASQRWC